MESKHQLFKDALEQSENTAGLFVSFEAGRVVDENLGRLNEETLPCN